MKYSAKDISIIALTAVLTVVFGYVFYLAGSLIPIPGYKFVVFAPFLGLMMYIPVARIRRIGVISAASFVFALLMAPVTFFMGIAILATGVCTDLVSFLIFRKYTSTKKIIASVAFFPSFAVLWAFLISNYLTGNVLYRLAGGWLVIGFLCIVLYPLGILGAYISDKFIYKRITKTF